MAISLLLPACVQSVLPKINETSVEEKLEHSEHEGMVCMHFENMLHYQWQTDFYMLLHTRLQNTVMLKMKKKTI